MIFVLVVVVVGCGDSHGKSKYYGYRWLVRMMVTGEFSAKSMDLQTMSKNKQQRMRRDDADGYSTFFSLDSYVVAGSCSGGLKLIKGFSSHHYVIV